MLNIPTFFKLTFSLVLFLSISSNSFAVIDEKKPNNNLSKGVFIVASDKLNNSPLAQTVLYITQHDHAGTSGFIVNRPTNVNINKAFPKIHASDSTNKMLYFGGPLHTTYLFMLTQTDFGHGLHAIKNKIFFGAGDQVKMRLRSENKRDKIRAFAGFMSWGPQQLSDEIERGNWVLTPATTEQLFTQDTSTLWKTLYTRWGGSWI